MINFLSFQCLKFAGDMEQKEALMSGFWELSRRLGAAGYLPNSIILPKHVKQGTNPPDVKQISLEDRIWYLERSQYFLQIFLAHIDQDLLQLFQMLYDSVKKEFSCKSLNQRQVLQNLGIDKGSIVKRFGFNALRAIIPGCWNKQSKPEVVYACAVFRFMDILKYKDCTHYKTVLGVLYIIAAVGENTPLYMHWKTYTNRYNCLL